jgi:hypothetical protein
MKATPLEVVQKTQPEPARPLGPNGQRLWDEVERDFPIDNPAAAELLLLAAESVDRLTELRQAHKTCDDEKGLNRLSRDITATVALIASLLAKLDKFVERKPRRGPGRPPTNVYWDGFENALD